MNEKKNKHIGSSLQSFLDEEEKDWKPETKRDEYFLTEEEVSGKRSNQIVPLDPETRPDRLSQLIRDAEELIRDYAPEQDEPAPLWRDFVIVATQTLRSASRVWDLEFEVEEDLKKQR